MKIRQFLKAERSAHYIPTIILLLFLLYVAILTLHYFRASDNPPATDHSFPPSFKENINQNL